MSEEKVVSHKMNKAIRSGLVTLLVEDSIDKKMNELKKREAEIARKFYEREMAGFAYVIKSKPFRFFTTTRDILLSREGHSIVIEMDDFRPAFNRHVFVEVRADDPDYIEAREIKDKIDEIRASRRSVCQEIMKALTLINTTAQLKEQWPEAWDLLPPEYKDPKKNLPMKPVDGIRKTLAEFKQAS
ncbi:Nmad5 family putative nucleotide modification protein [Ectothiorhodospira shaposhnikovii]|uniref:Nmad5 family putative nucleotide modification protein n=1 Tax=Ectothiorhodospira shaposhnikovii TaxID=1054 RepID=UPI001EE816BC|nr:Nmad5 family putative nucleotide modification protein [Ectothiorhodospira shaposhnikovii]MCG5512796.1 hypothetical protein [Ectothiorhodospira shaposhnikovii]